MSEQHIDEAPVPPPPPTDEEWRERTRAMNRRTRMWSVALAVALVFSVWALWYTAGAKAASVDSNNSSKIALANNERQGCLSDRAAIEADAGHDRDDALGLALYAALVQNDSDEALRQGNIMKDAITRRIAASKRRESAEVNAPVAEGGCGPVISSLSDIPDNR